jgi:parallel beta-helix repeat protein
MNLARRIRRQECLRMHSRQDHSLWLWAPVHLLVLVSLLLVGWSGLVSAKALEVANNGIDSATCGSSAAPCRSISQAIVHASEGDTIVVGPGHYGDLNGNGIFGEPGEEAADVGSCSCMIKINKRLTLVSSGGAAATVLDVNGFVVTSQSGFQPHGVVIQADGVVFGGKSRGFTIINSLHSGLFVGGNISNVRVAGNIATQNGAVGANAFQIQGSGHTISGNIAHSNASGGFGIQGSGHTVRDNVASDNRTGFELVASSGEFTRNVASGNGVFGGINVVSSELEIRRNAVIGNGGDGIRVSQSDVTITENNIFGNGTLSNNCGLTNLTGPALMALKNFWGAASGPGPDPADAICGDATIVDPVATKPFNIP